MAVIVNEAKKKCAEGKVALGAGMRITRTMEVGMGLKTCGYDWLFIDTEHGTMNLDTAAQISVAALKQGITPIVRVAALEGHLCSRILDGGAQGIVLPHVNTAEEAREFVSICKFPPLGHRSAAGGSPQAEVEPIPPAELLPALNRETMLIPMIETPEAGENAEAIAAVEGIDALLIGTNDLCTVMGIPGQFEHERVNRVYEQVIGACRTHGKTPGMGGAYAPAIIERRIKEGMRLILCGNDLAFMMAGARAQADAIRKVQV